MNAIDAYFEKINEILTTVLETQKNSIEQSAQCFADTIVARKKIFAFGCSHGAIIAEEMFYRAGGLAVVNPIFNPALMLNIRPVTLTSEFERMESQSAVLLDASGASEGDCILIHSVSGRNPGVVEMAVNAKNKGMTVIGLTNVAYSSASKSRDKSGKLLYQLCDICIDNKGDFGDGSIQLSGLSGKVGPTSTVIGAAIVNSISVRTAEILIERGVDPPMIQSANIDGNDEKNKKIFEEFAECILYM